MDLSIKRRKHKIIPLITAGFFCLVGWLLYHSLSEIHFSEVKESLALMNREVMGIGLGMVILNYLILASFDFLGLRYLHAKDLSWWKIYWSAFTCYTFTLNLGALVGGLGLRYRIYSGWQVPANTITKLIIFSTLGNWLGHIFLLSIVMSIYSEKVQLLTSLPEIVIWGIGLLGFMAVMLYFVLCYRRSEITIKKEKFTFPPLPLALLQLGLSIIQWGLLCLIIMTLMDHITEKEINFSQVLFTYLMTGLAGVVTHIPAGLGVHETIFIKMQFPMSIPHIIAVLLSFRAIYYLIPLLFALPGYIWLEIFQRRSSPRH